VWQLLCLRGRQARIKYDVKSKEKIVRAPPVDIFSLLHERYSSGNPEYTVTTANTPTIETSGSEKS
jgi:hypothetical protein